VSVVAGDAAASRSGWVVVTCPSSCMGREFAFALAERGYLVLAVARRGERLRAHADKVEAGGGRLEPLVADRSTAAGIEALLALAAELEVELLVNNAGIASYGPFASASAERERGLVRLNVEAIVTLTRGLLPQLFPHLQPRRVVESALRAHERGGRAVKVVGRTSSSSPSPGASRHGPPCAG
jgi:short-subunit dehydrogenase